MINTDLMNILGRIKGTVERRLKKMGDLIYSYGEERFGLIQPRIKETPTKSRRREIEQLVKERQLRKQWRKASEDERLPSTYYKQILRVVWQACGEV